MISHINGIRKNRMAIEFLSPGEANTFKIIHTEVIIVNLIRISAPGELSSSFYGSA